MLDPTPLVFRRLSLHAFRNFSALSFEPSEKLNLIVADNGSGKTSVLEALYFVATTRSFRVERPAALVKRGAERAVVRAEVAEALGRREQRGEIAGSTRRMSIDGKRPKRLVSYALRTPVVAFHPGDLELVAGGAAARRRLLDRAALFVDPSGYDARAAYERALRGRQRVLEERGPQAADLDAYEALVAEHGARFQKARERGAQALLDALSPAFETLAPDGLELRAAFVPGGSTDPDHFLSEARARRAQDLGRRAPTFGPQRDELELGIDAGPARQHASQGQQRIITLALKLAELDCVTKARGVRPVLLLDDVSSELDPARTGAVYRTLSQSASQIFVTAARGELFPPELDQSGRTDWTIEGGSIRRT